MQQVKLPVPHKKLLVLLGILGAVAIGIVILLATQPDAKTHKPGAKPGISITTLRISPQPFQPEVLSYGLVQPRIKSKLVAQVNGRIEYVSERFRDGGFFKSGDILLKIEAADYEIEVEFAAANLAEAERRFEEEKALSDQARADWLRLGQSKEPSPMVLRKPQLNAAEANRRSAKAGLQKALINQARTEIRAPFDGRVLTTSIDLGQVTSTNAVLGEIYATDAIEIRLPIKNSEIPLLDLPETYRLDEQAQLPLPNVAIYSELAGQEIWQGKIVRTAGSIDSTSRQLYVVARIEDPFGERALGRFPLKIGQYVTAKIAARQLDSVITIPNSAIYQGSYVYVYRDGAVFRQDIGIGWQNGATAIVTAGLNPGDELVSSPLGQVASGTRVNLAHTDQNTARPTPAAASNNQHGIQDWLASLPEDRLARIKQRAEQTGRPVEEIAVELRERGRSNRESP